MPAGAVTGSGAATRRPPSKADRERTPGGKRLVLLAVAGLLTAAAALAIGILLLGDFGSTEGRILATTALVAAYGLSTLPAAMLRDRRRAPALALAVTALAVAAAVLTTVAVWSDGGSDALGKAIGTGNGWLLAAVQTAALTARAGERDPRVVRLLFGASTALVVVLAGLFTVLLWAELDSERLGRVFGALVVLDVLLVALQPVLARARPRAIVHRLRVAVDPDQSIELAVEAPDLAAAAAKAIRAAEREGRRVLAVEVDAQAREASTARSAKP